MHDDFVNEISKILGAENTSKISICMFHDSSWIPRSCSPEMLESINIHLYFLSLLHGNVPILALINGHRCRIQKLLVIMTAKSWEESRSLERYKREYTMTFLVAPFALKRVPLSQTEQHRRIWRASRIHIVSHSLERFECAVSLDHVVSQQIWIVKISRSRI